MKKQNSTPKLLPEKVIRPRVSPEEVGRYYLKSELGRIFPGQKEIRENLDRRIDKLDSFEFWRLLQALSFAYRLNYIFLFVGNSGYSWSEETWRISRLTLTGINPDINAITFSPEISRSPIKFRDFLKKYFADHPQDDPQKLNEFRPSQRPIDYPRIILREDEANILLLDGSNRLIELMFRQEEEVVAFIGRKNGKKEKFRIGDSTFLLLRNLYEKGDSQERRAVLKVVKMLLGISLDGRRAVENYWVRHPRDEKLKAVGRSLLKAHTSKST
ncbi:hypothetical protein A2V56_04820 [Candidatus Woesebacteria bacterium RBG_19FT_COMBO_42_9]|uniref:Uncharacterized protein n=1 Tax=Candidatus Woesebacteria bacterium RBG_16_42_24 TaxID=1802485 RepID=A0A1F7XLI0_9BACT|nr:MAG: hypothetical protein A2V97_04055 [Candidatus Woesebacteria bacterium RBG_16_42_24]OGM17721.1 MAG: hypothetical protein A2V56_04820 [Candidatus Woesebacteria bacterium RBG_19FT_COMBO_42_9]OGM66537.1 MAG: hypothetical protein A2985_03030 [Candidatus Woesebacteria bacterium RIFCSPLOWO2_01_FULL_43_11]